MSGRRRRMVVTGLTALFAFSAEANTAASPAAIIAASTNEKQDATEAPLAASGGDEQRRAPRAALEALELELPRSEMRPGAEPLGGGVELRRSAGEVGCLFESGQQVEYGLPARAGELVLLDLLTAGFARGWNATLRLRVFDPEGELVLDRTRRGGVEFETFAGFTAGKEGRHRLVVESRDGGFRYRIVRHAGFAPRTKGARMLRPGAGEELEVHDYLLHDGDVARFRVRLGSGERAVFKVEPVSSRARDAERTRKRELGPGALWNLAPAGADGMMGMTPRGAAPSRGSMGAMGSSRSRDGGEAPRPDAPSMTMSRERGVRDRGAAVGESWPIPRLEVSGPDGRSLGEDMHYRLVEAPREGIYTVKVRTAREGQGGIVRLTVERAPALQQVRGRILDPEGEGVEGIHLLFLREPDLDPEAVVKSLVGGEYSVDLHPGPYTIQLTRGSRTQVLRTHVEAGEQLNLLAP